MTDSHIPTDHKHTPDELRKQIRQEQHTGVTSGLCPGYLQANVVILPSQYAQEFKQFCELNRQACPILEQMKPGQTQPTIVVDATKHFSDIRTDIPRYHVFRNGVFEREVLNIKDLWRDDLVAFFFGCSFSFEKALMNAGIEIRNITERKNVSMYKTNRICKGIGAFQGVPLVVSMRPIKKHLVQKAIDITNQFTNSHGAPIHCGDASELGIHDLAHVDFGDAVTIDFESEIPCFWACGVTTQLAALSVKSDLLICHAPGHMFVIVFYVFCRGL
jgi:uncharacterized protein YcsI (UPF0317 family)